MAVSLEFVVYASLYCPHNNSRERALSVACNIAAIYGRSSSPPIAFDL
ncbi:hypothetical protein [Mariprofundus erugo]|nr:hypothetical protein [Mariprofundus erugo]